MSMCGPTLFVFLAISYTCNAQFWGGNYGGNFGGNFGGFQQPIGAQTRLVGWPTYNALTNIQTSYVYPGNPCGARTGCGGGSFCYSGSCSCPTGYIVQAQSCVVQTVVAPAPVVAPAIVAIGSPCGGYGGCGGGASCLRGVCGCGSGYVAQAGGCVVAPVIRPVVQPAYPIQRVPGPAPLPYVLAGPVAIGSPCSTGGSCGYGASCLSGTCGCGSGYYAAAGGCRRRRR